MIATHVSEYRPGTMDYVQANQEINRAFTSVLWEVLKTPEYSFEIEPSYYAEIKVRLTGSVLPRQQTVRPMSRYDDLRRMRKAKFAAKDDGGADLRPSRQAIIDRHVAIMLPAPMTRRGSHMRLVILALGLLAFPITAATAGVPNMTCKAERAVEGPTGQQREATDVFRRERNACTLLLRTN